MQKIVSRCCALAVILVSLVIFPITANAQSSNVSVIDDADLLTDSEESDIADYLDRLDESINYIVVTSNQIGSSADSILEDYYRSQYSSTSDGVAFIVDMFHREIYMQGYGDLRSKLTSGDCTDITDNVYTYASNGNYYLCIMKAMSQADTVINEGFIVRPMRIIVSALISIIIGFLIVFYWAMYSRKKRSPVEKSRQALLFGAGAVATASIYQTKRYARSSGGGGYHGGGGGGHHGGGGGHSGGGHSF